jgi:hypothetical protein
MFKNLKNKLKQLTVAVYATISGFMFSANQMLCDTTDAGWSDLENSTGFQTIFDQIGKVYFKWAWFVGGLAFVIYMTSKGNEKKAGAAKATIIGIIAGYIVFGFGGTVIEALFTSIGNAF